MSNATDQQLVENAQKGDVDSLGALYERYAQNMMWLAYSIVLDRQTAEDITQETFAHVCRKLAYLNKPERFSAWLTTICRRRAIDVLRVKRIKTVTLDEAYSEQAYEDPQNSGNHVQQAIAALPRIYREIVVLHYFNYMNYEQLQKTLGISIHAVKGRLCRARKKIGKYLKDNGLE